MKNLYLLTIILFFAGLSCKEQPVENHDHEHEEVKFQYTAYSSDFELFAEADAFIVGEKSNVLSHFSMLSDFKALEKGKITITLSVKGKETKQTLDQPTRKGIYSFDIQPETQGKGRLIFEITNDTSTFEVVVPEVTVFANDEEAHEASEKNVVSKANTTAFTKEQSWKVDFATATPRSEPFGQVIKTTAQFLPSQNDEAIISSKISGFVQFAQEITEGLKVSQGLILATIVGNELAENNISVRLQEAKNNFELHKSNYERGQKLADDKIISEKELMQLKTDFQNAKSIYENLKQHFTSQGQILNSNSNGFIGKVLVSNGQYVEAGQALFSVSLNKSLLIRAEVQQKYSSALDNIESAVFSVPGNQKMYSLNDCNGKLISIGKNIRHDNNFMIPVTFRIENNQGFLPGSFIDIYIKTKSFENKLIIPSTSLLEEQGNFFVFVQITPELFEKKQVKIGATDGFYTEIYQGLDITDRIVSKGAVIVKLAAVSNSLDPHAGHVH